MTKNVTCARSSWQPARPSSEAALIDYPVLRYEPSTPVTRRNALRARKRDAGRSVACGAAAVRDFSRQRAYCWRGQGTGGNPVSMGSILRWTPALLAIGIAGAVLYVAAFVL